MQAAGDASVSVFIGFYAPRWLLGELSMEAILTARSWPTLIETLSRIIYNFTRRCNWRFSRKLRVSRQLITWVCLVISSSVVLTHNQLETHGCILSTVTTDAQGPIPETIRSLWKSDRITNFSSAHDFAIRSDSTNDPASIGSWSWRSCSLLGSVLDQKFHHNQQLVILSVISP